MLAQDNPERRPLGWTSATVSRDTGTCSSARAIRTLSRIGSAAYRHPGASSLKIANADDDDLPSSRPLPGISARNKSSSHGDGLHNRSPSIETPRSSSSLNFWRRRVPDHLESIAVDVHPVECPDASPPERVNDIERRIKTLVSELSTRQNEVENIAVLAAHATSMWAQESASLKSANMRLRSGLSTVTMGLQSLTSRMKTLEDQVRSMAGEDLATASLEGEERAKLRLRIEDWWNDYESIMERLCDKLNTNTDPVLQSPSLVTDKLEQFDEFNEEHATDFGRPYDENGPG